MSLDHESYKFGLTILHLNHVNIDGKKYVYDM